MSTFKSDPAQPSDVVATPNSDAKAFEPVTNPSRGPAPHSSGKSNLGMFSLAEKIRWFTPGLACTPGLTIGSNTLQSLLEVPEV